MIPWWVNFLAGITCLTLAVNFLAMAYGLSLGDRPLKLVDFPKYEPRVQDMPPHMPLNGR